MNSAGIGNGCLSKVALVNLVSQNGVCKGVNMKFLIGF
jgi:hypothetical protein